MLNNAPTKESIGAERQVDPMPSNGSMTFVFEDENSREVIQGKATPRRSRVNDFFANAENSAADYGKKNHEYIDRCLAIATLNPADFEGCFIPVEALIVTARALGPQTRAVLIAATRAAVLEGADVLRACRLVRELPDLEAAGLLHLWLVLGEKIPAESAEGAKILSEVGKTASDGPGYAHLTTRKGGEKTLATEDGIDVGASKGRRKSPKGVETDADRTVGELKNPTQQPEFIVKG